MTAQVVLRRAHKVDCSGARSEEVFEGRLRLIYLCAWSDFFNWWPTLNGNAGRGSSVSSNAG